MRFSATGFRDAINPTTATRGGILVNNLAHSMRLQNRPIRQAIGFREKGLAAARKPCFNSKTVRKLYNALDGLAKSELDL